MGWVGWGGRVWLVGGAVGGCNHSLPIKYNLNSKLQFFIGPSFGAKYTSI